MRVSAARGGEPYWPAAPVFLMLASVGIWAVAPLVIALSGASRSPFLFAASMEAGAIASYLLFLLAFYRDLLADRSVLLVLGRHLLRRGWELVWLLLGILSGLSYALFAWSTRFVDVSVSAVLFDGLWPFVLVMMFFLLYRGSGRYRAFTPSLGLLLLLGMAGCVLVVSSQGFDLDRSVFSTLLGIGLVLLCPLIGPLASCLFRWATSLADALRGGGVGLEACGRVRLELFGGACGVVGRCRFLSAGQPSYRHRQSGERFHGQMLSVGLLTGAFVYTVGGITWRLSNLTALSPGVNALGYLSPAFSLGLLWAFGQVGVSSYLMLLVGTALVVVANVLINAGPWVRLSLGRVAARLSRFLGPEAGSLG